jgi:hypothetical protein
VTSVGAVTYGLNRAVEPAAPPESAVALTPSVAVRPPTPAGRPTKPRVGEKPAKCSALPPTLTPAGKCQRSRGRWASVSGTVDGERLGRVRAAGCPPVSANSARFVQAVEQKWRSWRRTAGLVAVSRRMEISRRAVAESWRTSRPATGETQTCARNRRHEVVAKLRRGDVGWCCRVWGRTGPMKPAGRPGSAVAVPPALSVSPPTTAGTPTTLRVREKPAKCSANSPTLPLAPSATPSPAPTEAQSPPPNALPILTALPPTTRPAPRRDSHSSFATPSHTSLTRAASPDSEEFGESPAFAVTAVRLVPGGRAHPAPRPPGQTARRGGGSQAARPPPNHNSASCPAQANHDGLANDDRRATSHTAAPPAPPTDRTRRKTQEKTNHPCRL